VDKEIGFAMFVRLGCNWVVIGELGSLLSTRL
jgi:hypothetical protein